ncbi:hypothetical protein [Mesorhizobium sp. L-8-3]|uniref:hypothetical protein n=1 Tax=Mesorhizobium sp. L-8-3 TaxID=2744522 RepID=UPI001928B689|nr:hypothetical protein [Mesorhizobium sp. L-8-3]BCH23817.1 hypothetical protein MesoLjLb_36020 [Mesorhizobium sp. L-8-3]
MAARSAFAALVALVVFGATYHAMADEKILRAMSSLISAAPPSQSLPGNMVNGSLVVENRSDASSFVGVFAPGPGLCIVRLHSIRQSQNDWAESGTIAFDFTKIKQVRWLSDTDDLASAPSRSTDAPEVRTVAIDAETPWLCRDIVYLATAKPAFASTCYKTWTVAVPTPADRAAAANAIELVEKSCVATKQ